MNHTPPTTDPLDLPPPQPAGRIAAEHDAALPADNRSAGLSPQALAEAQHYGRLQLAAHLADKVLDLVYLTGFALLAARPLDAFLARGIDSRWLRLTLFYGVCVLVHEAVSFPLGFYAGHVLERRFGLSRQSFGGWLARHLKLYALAAAFGLLLFVGLFALIWWWGEGWWLLAAGGFFLTSAVVGQVFPVLILPLFYRIERLELPELAARIARLTEGTGLAVDGVYRLQLSDETAKANAMLAGLGRTRRVLLGDTLLAQFTPDEIEVILAHEVGHHVYRHLNKLLLAALVWSGLGFWVCDRLLTRWLDTGATSLHELPVFALAWLLLALSVFSLLIEPLQNVLSRHFERQCDRYALSRTGLRDAYRSAFRKLAQINKDDPHPHPLEVWLFHSHPPIAERLALADG